MSTKLVSVRILYWRPDFPRLLNTFFTQMDDEVPGLIKVRKFLRHWDEEIDARIREVALAIADSSDWKRGSWETLAW